MRRTRAAVHDGAESGLGMILVIGVSILIFTLASAATALAVNGISQSRERTGYETSLAVAEAGIDRALSEVQRAYDTSSSDFPIPGPVSAVAPAPWCLGTPVTFPAAGSPGAGGVWSDGPAGSAEDQESAWARTELWKIVALGGGSCIQEDERGEYVVLKPVSPVSSKYGKVYALSAIPSFSDPDARTRVIKSEYIFMPYRPAHAILADGRISLGSASTTVGEADGVPAGMASVHSNGEVVSSGGSTPSVSGPITSSAASGAGFVTKNAPRVSVPRVSARSFYENARAVGATADVYDLCPDGKMRYYSTAPTPVPCTGAEVPQVGGLYRNGWKFEGVPNGATRDWTVVGKVDSGTYYAYQSNIVPSTGGGTANDTIDRLTLVAEAQGTDCSKTFGNITWKKYNIGATHTQGIWMLADTDLDTDANITIGRKTVPVVAGIFAAADQLRLNTSSSDVVGSVIVGDACNTPAGGGGLFPKGTSEVKNISLYFDPDADAPFASIITTTLWLDYRRG